MDDPLLESRVIALLYLLGRDHLPLGVITELVISLRENVVFTFTNKHLEGYSLDMLARLKETV